MTDDGRGLSRLAPYLCSAQLAWDHDLCRAVVAVYMPIPIFFFPFVRMLEARLRTGDHPESFFQDIGLEFSVPGAYSSYSWILQLQTRISLL